MDRSWIDELCRGRIRAGTRAIQRVEMTAGSRMIAASHESLLFVLVVDGQLRCDDGVELRGGGDCRLWWVQAGTGLNAATAVRCWSWASWVEPQPEEFIDLRGEGCQRLAWICSEALEEKRQRLPWRRERIIALLQLLATALRRSGPRAGGNLSMTQIVSLRAVVRGRLPLVADGDDLARALGLSRIHTARLIKRTFGVPPRTWITGERLRCAANLLLTERRTIAAIAAACGYVDPARFSRQFRRFYTIAPRDFAAKGLSPELDFSRLAAERR